MIKKIALAMALMMIPAIGHAQDLSNGQELFKRKCKGCHRLSQGVKMGPSLSGVTKRRSEEWLHKWLQDPQAMIDSGDPDAVALVEKYKKKMPKLKAMQDESNRKDVIAFLRENDKDS